MSSIRMNLNSLEARKALDNNYKFNRIEKGSGLTPTYIYFETKPCSDHDTTDTECEDDMSVSSMRSSSSRNSIFSLTKWNDDCDDDRYESESSLSLYGSSKWDCGVHNGFTSSTFDDDDDYSEISMERNMPYLKHIKAPKKIICESTKLFRSKKEKQRQNKSFLKHLNSSKKRSESRKQRVKRREAQIRMMYSDALDVPIATIQEKFKTKTMKPRVLKTTADENSIEDSVQVRNIPILRHAYSKKPARDTDVVKIKLSTKAGKFQKDIIANYFAK